MMADYYILSSRKICSRPVQAATTEFEDVLVECCGGVLFTPAPSGDVAARGRLPARRTMLPPRHSRSEQVLIVVGNHLGFVVTLLASIPDYRRRFDVICAYIIDAFPFASELSKPLWRRRLSRFSRTLSSLDHLFVPIGLTAATLGDLYGVPTSFVPMACDVVRFGSGGSDRPIDLMGYGRQHAAHSAAFADAYNDPASHRIYSHTDHIVIGAITDFHRHRRLFWKNLCRSRVALAYDPLAVNPNGQFPCSFVSLRWFECLTAGCLIAGRRPTCPEMDDLFFWEDSTIEVPEKTEDVVPFMEDLLADTERLDAAHHRNYTHALAHHDWRYRIASMLDRLQLPHPEPLQRNLEQLRERCRTLIFA